MAFFELGGEDARLQHAAAMRGAPSAPSTSTGRHALQRSAEPNVTASASGPCYASTAGACASSESTPRGLREHAQGAGSESTPRGQARARAARARPGRARCAR